MARSPMSAAPPQIAPLTAPRAAAGAGPSVPRAPATSPDALFEGRLAEGLGHWLARWCGEGGVQQAVLGWASGPVGQAELSLLAARPEGLGETAPELQRAWRLLLCEALDQGQTLAWPDGRTLPAAPVRVALRDFMRDRTGGVLALVLRAGEQPVGVLGLWRSAAPWSPDDIQRFEQQLRWLGPALALRVREEWPWRRRLHHQLQVAWQALTPPQHRRLVWAAAAVLTGLLLAPWAEHRGGQARVEGAVQRTVSAPADGFLQRVHVRPGETVRAGAPLLDLAQQDLLLEQQRWQSQLAQHENAFAAAGARADRTQWAVQQAQAAEAEAQLSLVEERLARSRLTAPFDALVLDGDLSQTLGAPVTQGQALMTLAPLDQFRVVIEVEERDIAAVRVGQMAELALTAWPWQTQAMRVTRIAPVARAVEGRNVFEVEAALQDGVAGLRPGLQGQARIEVGRAPGLWSATRRVRDALRRFWWQWTGW